MNNNMVTGSDLEGNIHMGEDNANPSQQNP
jgi:hypothetical protein